jgi:hypothetical protein
MNESRKSSKDYCLILGITQSMTVRSRSVLFNKSDENKSLTLDERIKKCFSEKALESSFHVKDLREFAESVKVEGKYCEHEVLNQPKNYIIYDLPYASSLILTFGFDSNGGQPEEYLKAVHTILFSSRLPSPKDVLFNEWAIVSNDENRYMDDWRVAYDLLLLLGRRRSRVFANQLALRIFNICLPVGRLRPRAAKDSETKNRIAYQNEVFDFVAIPVLTLDAKPQSTFFRNTISLSLVLVPVNEKYNRSRKVSAHEMCHVKDDTEFDIVDSPLKEFLAKIDPGFDGGPSLTARQLSVLLCRTIHDVASKPCETKETEKSWERAYHQLLMSTHFTQSILASDLDNRTIERFYQNSISSSFRNELRCVVTPASVLNDRKRFEFPETADFERMLVTDRSKIESDSLVFFNKQYSTIIDLIPSEQERFSETSVRWRFAWHLYMSINMSVMDAMIYSFHDELLSERHQVEALGIAESEFVKDIDEFYELDILNSIYKERYEKIRAIDGLDKDFKMLKAKLAAIKTNLVLDEQRRFNKEQNKINKNTERLTIVSVGIAVAAIIIAILPWLL